jgi:hypothetical protein
MYHKVEFLDSGREPQCPPDPAFPKGKDVNLMLPSEIKSCTVALPYPAPRCGLMMVKCIRCDVRVAVTVAGRPDDPRSVKMGCRDHGQAH